MESDFTKIYRGYSDDELAEAVYNAKAEEAAEIINDGRDAQIAYLVALDEAWVRAHEWGGMNA